MKPYHIKQITNCISDNRKLTTKQVVIINIDNITRRKELIEHQQRYAYKQIKKNKNLDDWQSYLKMLQKDLEKTKRELEDQKYIFENLP